MSRGRFAVAQIQQTINLKYISYTARILHLIILFKVSTQTPWPLAVQSEGVVTISCTVWTNSYEAPTQVTFNA